jgi:hypothetical protein
MGWIVVCDGSQKIKFRRIGACIQAGATIYLTS